MLKVNVQSQPKTLKRHYQGEPQRIDGMTIRITYISYIFLKVGRFRIQCSLSYADKSFIISMELYFVFSSEHRKKV